MGGGGGALTFRDFHCKPPACFSPEMLESNNLVTFEGLANSSAYHTFLLDEERGRLVVGAKDHIFSFNLLNVSRDYAKVTQTKGGTRKLESSRSLAARPFCPAAGAVCASDRLKCASSIRSASQERRYPGICLPHPPVPPTQKCLMNISERSCCTRSHAVPAMLDALWPPG